MLIRGFGFLEHGERTSEEEKWGLFVSDLKFRVRIYRTRVSESDENNENFSGKKYGRKHGHDSS